MNCLKVRESREIILYHYIDRRFVISNMTTLKAKIAKITIVTYLSAYVSTLLFPRFSRRIQIIGRSETRCRARGCPFSFYRFYSYVRRDYKTRERESANVNEHLFLQSPKFRLCLPKSRSRIKLP